MKDLEKFLMIIVIACFTLAISSCGNGKTVKSKESTEQTEEVNMTSKEYTSAYICPMHCKDSGSDKPGECPVCGMDYKKNEEHSADGHSHEGHDHIGHEH